MPKAAKAQPDAILACLDALSDVTRLRLLRLLDRHELGVADLCNVLQLPQSTVSRHLKMLTDHGWLTHRRAGTAHLYRMLRDEIEPVAADLWKIAGTQFDKSTQHAQDQLRLTELLRARRHEAQTFFAGAAGDWDKLRDELYGSRYATQAMLALLPSDWTVADLGCGTGQTAVELAMYVAGVIGVDQSEPMLEAAHARVATTGDLASRIELRPGAMEALPIDDATCDAAIMTLALSYTPDPAAALAEMARILKPGGRAVVIDLLRHDRDDFRRQMGQANNGFTPDDMTALLAEAGLTVASCAPVPPEKEAKGPALICAVASR